MLKKVLCSPPILLYPKLEKKFNSIIRKTKWQEEINDCRNTTAILNTNALSRTSCLPNWKHNLWQEIKEEGEILYGRMQGSEAWDNKINVKEKSDDPDFGQFFNGN